LIKLSFSFLFSSSFLPPSSSSFLFLSSSFNINKNNNNSYLYLLYFFFFFIDLCSSCSISGFCYYECLSLVYLLWIINYFSSWNIDNFDYICNNNSFKLSDDIIDNSTNINNFINHSSFHFHFLHIPNIFFLFLLLLLSYSLFSDPPIEFWKKLVNFDNVEDYINNNFDNVDYINNNFDKNNWNDPCYITNNNNNSFSNNNNSSIYGNNNNNNNSFSFSQEKKLKLNKNIRNYEWNFI
jgi:hypothetical protein